MNALKLITLPAAALALDLCACGKFEAGQQPLPGKGTVATAERVSLVGLNRAQRLELRMKEITGYLKQVMAIFRNLQQGDRLTLLTGEKADLTALEKTLKLVENAFANQDSGMAGGSDQTTVNQKPRIAEEHVSK